MKSMILGYRDKVLDYIVLFKRGLFSFIEFNDTTSGNFQFVISLLKICKYIYRDVLYIFFVIHYIFLKHALYSINTTTIYPNLFEIKLINNFLESFHFHTLSVAFSHLFNMEIYHISIVFRYNVLFYLINIYVNY